MVCVYILARAENSMSNNNMIYINARLQLKTLTQKKLVYTRKIFAN